ncbi:hypothetical protein TNCV_4615771 [Trichonephila clavipes]|nr:hypothetical protein TNCV_4615771 [Trichonephila clavipes]
MTDSIPDKTTVPCKQSDDTNLLTDVKPTVSRHGRLVKKNLRTVKAGRKDTEGRFVLDTLRSECEYLTDHAKTIVFA